MNPTARERAKTFYQDVIFAFVFGDGGFLTGPEIEQKLEAEFIAAEQAARDDWRPMETAPKDGTRFLAAVDGVVRVLAWGKTSHVPLYGFCIADQGVEEFDLCEPTEWTPMPTLSARGAK